MKKKINISDKMRIIKPYVNFNYSLKDIKAGKLSKYAEDKINKYFNIVYESTAQPTYAYKPRSDTNRQKAFDYANQKNDKNLKVVFIPVPQQGMKPQLKFNKNGLTLKTGFVKTTHIPFNKRKLLEDREKEVERVLNKFPDSFKRFTVQCGQFEYLVASDRGSIDNTVARLMERYGNETANNYHGKWLNGLFGYEFENQSTTGAYFAAKSRARKKLQKQRRNIKRSKGGLKNLI